ncbi:Uncharacterized protein GBIM_18335 [Gryllus bimaculatus]|nr:Uncharacterized protein GBIM_18335 [Gryllus bimaculatus]
MTLPAARKTALLWLWLSAVAAVAVAAPGPGPSPGPQKANHELLTNLGMVRRRVAPAHHRKRLAAEMRSSGAHDDSHMVVIKLPPAPYYYAHAKPAKTLEPSHNAVSKPALHFHGNGKPTGVYHWNLPVLKKMKAGHARHGGAAKRTSDGDSKIYHIQKTSPFTEHHDDPAAAASSNDVLKAKESQHAPAFSRKSHAPKSKISYYTPRRKTMFQKLFQGNGKPHSFYVIEKSKKPIHYHRLLP